MATIAYDKGWSNDIVDIVNGLGHALAHVPAADEIMTSCSRATLCCLQA